MQDNFSIVGKMECLILGSYRVPSCESETLPIIPKSVEESLAGILDYVENICSNSDFMEEHVELLNKIIGKVSSKAKGQLTRMIDNVDYICDESGQYYDRIKNVYKGLFDRRYCACMYAAFILATFWENVYKNYGDNAARAVSPWLSAGYDSIVIRVSKKLFMTVVSAVVGVTPF